MNCSSGSLETFSAHWFKKYHYQPDKEDGYNVPKNPKLLTGLPNQEPYLIFGNFKKLEILTIHECYLEEDYLFGANNLEELTVSNTKYLLNTESNTNIIKLPKLRKFTLILDENNTLAKYYRNLKIDLRTVLDLHIVDHYLTHNTEGAQNDADINGLMSIIRQLKQLHRLNLDLNVPIPIAMLGPCLNSMSHLEIFGTLLYSEDSDWRDLICNVNNVRTFIVDYVHSSSTSKQATEESIQKELLAINVNKIASVTFSNWQFTIHCKGIIPLMLRSA